MTPDDVSVPGDDAIARAARDGLRHLAGSHARPLDWDAVRTRARRVRQQRAVAFVAACALVIGSAGAAVASTGREHASAPIAGRGEPTTTSTSTSVAPAPTTTGTTATAMTTIDRSNPSVAAGPQASDNPTSAVPVALPSDFTGSITLASTLWHVDEPQPVALTVRNVSDHPVAFPTDGIVGIGVYISFLDNREWGRAPFAPGEQRTYSATIAPSALSMGATRITAGFVRGIVMDVGGYLIAPFPSVASVPITIAPPGWNIGDPYDPAMGEWEVALSVDNSRTSVDDPIRVHARVTNTGDEVQELEGYSSIALSCGGGTVVMDDDHVPSLAPGESTTWSADLWPLDDNATITCSAGILFSGDADITYRDGFVDQPVTFSTRPQSLPSTPSTTTTSTP